jgi:uncharacterized phage-associated protein
VVGVLRISEDVMAPISALKASECLLAFVAEHGDCLTNLKLQKILYYMQGWHLGLYTNPLFDDKFEAWVRGPVVPAVYHTYKKYGSKPIPTELDPTSPSLADIPKGVWDHVAEVWSAYGGWTAYDLERLSHTEDPWKEARVGLEPDEPSSNTLSEATMARFFSEKVRGE